MPTSVDIILPCYNPLPNWEIKVKENFNAIKKEVSSICDLSLIIINDGSKTPLQNEISNLKTELPNSLEIIEYKENKGKGFALREGIRCSNADYIIYTDIDFPYMNESLISVIKSLINKEADLILTKRNESYYNQTDFIRKSISKILKTAIKILLRMNFLDTQAGLKGMSKSIKPIFLSTKINRYLFDLEFVKISQRKKVNTKVLTINLKSDVVLSKLNVKIIFFEFVDFIKIIFR